MEIPLKVDGQRIRDVGCDKLIANKSQKFVKFKFDLSSEWKPLKVFAQFSQGHSSYNQYLDSDNCAFLPAEIKSGICYMMLYGTGGENVIGTTNRVVLTVTESGFVGDANSTEISQSLYDQLVEEVRGFAGDVNSKADRVYVDTELNKKADKVAVADSLALKADKTYVDDELNKKQNKGDYALKSELIEVDPTLTQTGKAADAKTTGDLIKTKAPAIRETAQGEVVGIKDSSENPFFNLAVCGKTTQNGVPTPDAPIPLETIGADGSMNVAVAKRNIVDDTKIAYHSESEQYRTLIFIKEGIRGTKKGITYTLSVDLEAESETIVYLNDRSGLFDYEQINVKSGKNRYLKTFVAKGESLDNTTLLSKYQSDNIVVTASNLQIEVGSVATPYEPYTAQSITLPTPNGLNGIKVDKDGNYTDSTGQQWICDSIEKTEQGWAVVKRIGNIILDDKINYKFLLSNTHNITTFAVSEAVPGNNFSKFLIAFCDRFKRIYTEASNSTEEGFFINTAGQLYLRINADKANTTEEMKGYMGNHIGQFVYPITTPIITPITNPELTAQLDLLHTYYGVTTITATDNAGLKADYSADTKIYIDNKFTELQNAILSTGGNI